MATRNEHTGDIMRTKVPTQKYKDNWDKIFNKEKKDGSQKQGD